MNTLWSSRKGRSQTLGIALLSLSFGGCGWGDSDAGPAVRSRSQNVEDNVDAGLVRPSTEAQAGDMPEGHGKRSPEAILVDWDGSPQSSTEPLKALTARLSNTTDERIAVTVSTMMLAPGAAERTERTIGRHSIEPKGDIRLPIAIEDLPVQSSGVASALEVAATYEGSPDLLGPGEKPQTVTRPTNRIHSPHLYVMFADDFLTVTVRDEEDEARANGDLVRSGKRPRLTGLKVSGKLLSEKALSETRVQSLISLPADFLPSREGTLSK